MLSKDEYVNNLRKIYVAHKFYYDADVEHNEEDKGRILDACEGLFDKVVARYDSIPGSTTGGRGITGTEISDSVHDSGLDRSFGVLLLMYGDWFLKEQFGCEDFQEFVDKFIA